MAAKKWQSSAQRNDEDLQEINIFGYQCKLFRDDEKAMFIDQGKHLIPWMGDSSLMIDRYDGRGHIYDLAPYDSDNVDHHHMMLSDREKAVQKACDEERYLELNTDAMEHATYEEEEMKRLYEAMGEGYAAVAFNYDQPQQVQQIQPQKAEDEEDEPYETIPELQVPKGVNLPTTIKMHAIIEKTAAFVAKQGPQMEIVVATKQSNNPQFKFLHYSNELNVYYKHIVKMIKKGKYTAKPQEEYSRNRRRSSESHDGHHHGYLHPSLGGVSEADSTPVTSENFMISVMAKLPTGQIANTAYAKLLSNLSKHRPESPVPVAVQPESRLSKENAAENINQKHKYSQAEENGTRPVEAASAVIPAPIVAPGSQRLPPVPGVDPVTLPGPNQPPPPGTVPPDPPPPYLHHPLHQQDTLHNQHVVHYPGIPPPVPVGAATANPQPVGLVPYAQHSPGVAAPVGYNFYHGYEGHDGQQYPGYNGAVQDNTGLGDKTETPSLDSIPAHVVLPTDQTRAIIDKMAEYVIRNGPEFEMMMRNKNDERFSFLQSWHKYNAYYSHKREHFRAAAAAAQSDSAPQQKAVAGPQHQDSDEDSNQSTAKGGGVSFSIKVKESETGTIAPKRRALMGDDSDEEGEGSGREGGQPQTARQGGGGETTAAANEEKMASETLKNKLSQAARGKMVAAKEEEKVKAERKKKAAMFAAFIKHTGPSSPSHKLPVVASAPNLSTMEASGAEGGDDSPNPAAFGGTATPGTAATSRASSRSPAPGSRPQLQQGAGATEEEPDTVDIESSSGSSSRSSSASRSRSRSPSVVITKETYVVKKSRSRTPTIVTKSSSSSIRNSLSSKYSSRNKSSRSRSRSRDRTKGERIRRRVSRSRSRERFRSKRSRRRPSRSRSPKKRKSPPKTPPLPSAYSVMRRSSSPSKKPSLSSSSSSKRPRSSRSPSTAHKHHTSSRPSKSSRHRSCDRSRERTAKKGRRRSKSEEKVSSSSKSKSSSKSSHKKRDKSREKKKSKKSKKKPKMIPIPELTPPHKSSSSESEKEAPEVVLIADGSSAGNTPGRSSDTETTSSAKQPSTNILSKVRAMLKAQREELYREDGEID